MRFLSPGFSLVQPLAVVAIWRVVGGNSLPIPFSLFVYSSSFLINIAQNQKAQGTPCKLVPALQHEPRPVCQLSFLPTVTYFLQTQAVVFLLDVSPPPLCGQDTSLVPISPFCPTPPFIRAAGSLCPSPSYHQARSLLWNLFLPGVSSPVPVRSE